MLQQNADNLQFPRFIELESIDSTNNYALDLARSQNLTDRQVANIHGTTIFAHEQRNGKGQRGKKWDSATGKNVQMSLIIAPAPLKLHQQFILSAMIAVAVRDFIADITGEEIFIKWPNDIYFQDRKAGGILIENIILGREWKWAIAGIGLNINQTDFNPELPNPVSFKQITGREFDCVELAKELSAAVFEKIADCRLHITDYSAKILKDYNDHLYKLGQTVKLKKENRVFEAAIKEVAANGQLVVQTAMEERFDFGEVVWVI